MRKTLLLVSLGILLVVVAGFGLRGITQATDNQGSSSISELLNKFNPFREEPGIPFAPLENKTTEDTPRYVKGEIIVKFRSEKVSRWFGFYPNGEAIQFTEGPEIKTINLLNERYQVRQVRKVFPEVTEPTVETFSTILNKKIQVPDLFPIYVIEFPEEFDPIQVAKDYSKDPNIEWAEPNYIYELYSIPNDPAFSKQWGLHNTGQTGGTPDADIDAPEAWGIHRGSSEVIIAVIDTGVDYTHPDLAANMIQKDPPGDSNGDGCPGGCGVNDDNDELADLEDLQVRNTNYDGDKVLVNGVWVENPLHGVNGVLQSSPGNCGGDDDCDDVALAALDDDENGIIDDNYGYDFVNNDNDPTDDHFHGTHCAGIISGVTNNGIGIAGVTWNCKIMAVKFLSSDGSGYISNGAKSIKYAADNGAKVLSNSWGGGGQSNLIESAIDYAVAKGCIVVFAAGNDNTSNPAWGYPASYPPVIAVAATDHNDKKAWFSNYGEWIDISAPGVNIYSTLLNNTYGYKSGTSMACPMVSGAAALFLSKNPTWQAEQVWFQLLRAADNIDPKNPGYEGKLGAGRLNLYQGLREGVQACQDDWDPQDDNYEGATGITPQIFIQRHGPHSICGEDIQDWFKIEMITRVGYHFSTSKIGRSKDVLLEVLRGSDLAQVAAGTNSVSYSCEAGGIYYLKISRPEGSPGDWFWYGSLTYTRDSCIDSWDPKDDNRIGATEIIPYPYNQKHGVHSLCEIDFYDWFKIGMLKDKGYYFNVTPGGANVVLELYDEEGNKLVEGINGISFVAPAEKNYYLMLKTETITGVWHGYLEYWKDCGDKYDPIDNNPLTGNEIFPTEQAQTHSGHELCQGDEVDWFKVYLEAGKRYYFNSQCSKGDVCAKLYLNPEESCLIEDDDSAGDKQFSISYAPYFTGYHYLKLEVSKEATFNYWTGDLNYWYEEIGCKDRWDPQDDTPEGATLLIPKEYKQNHGIHELCYIDNYDWFYIDMEKGLNYNFVSEVERTKSKGDVVGELYNNNLELVAEDDNSANILTKQFHLSYTPEESGRYYLRIRGKQLGIDWQGVIFYWYLSKPRLLWAEEPNYFEGGVYPKTGDTETVFEYRIKYLDPQGLKPLEGYPKVYIWKLLAKGPSDTIAIPLKRIKGDDYTKGVIYSYKCNLAAGNYQYRFEAYNENNIPALPVFGEAPLVVEKKEVSDVKYPYSIVPIDNNIGEYICLSVDVNNMPYISYYDETNKALNYVSISGIQTIDTQGVGKYNSIAVDSEGAPHISYYDEENGNLKYTFYDGIMWNIEVIDTEGDVGLYTSIAIDSNNYPHISYYDRTNQDLKYAKWDGSSWIIETVDTEGDVGQYSSIAIDSSGNIHISYYDAINKDLKYARWSASDGWQIQAVDTERDVGEYTSIAIDSQGNPHIAYYDYSNGDLKYARWDGSSWSIQIVDSEGEVGKYTSIDIDEDDNPHISYYSAPPLPPPPPPGKPPPEERSLRYATFQEGSWKIYTIDPAGRESSIKVRSYLGFIYVHISYYVPATKELRYFRYSRPPELRFTAEPNYEDKGVHPIRGDKTTNFEYRVNYIDLDNDQPLEPPRLHILERGYPIIGSPFLTEELDPQDKNYTDGKIYKFSKKLLPGLDYEYYFEAYDMVNKKSIGPATSLRKGPYVFEEYEKGTSTGWAITDILTAGRYVGFVSMAVDNLGNPHILYSEGGMFLYLANLDIQDGLVQSGKQKS